MEVKYTKVRNDFIERKDLTAEEKIVIAWLYGRKRPDGKPWEFNVGQVAKATGVSEYAVEKMRPMLRRDGWLSDGGYEKPEPGKPPKRKRATVNPDRLAEVVAQTFPQVAPLTPSSLVREFGVNNEELYSNEGLSHEHDAGPGLPAGPAIGSGVDVVSSSTVPDSSTVNQSTTVDLDSSSTDTEVDGRTNPAWEHEPPPDPVPWCLICESHHQHHKPHVWPESPEPAF